MRYGECKKMNVFNLNLDNLISEGDKLLENYKLESKNNSKQNFQRKIETIVDETLDLFDVNF